MEILHLDSSLKVAIAMFAAGKGIIIAVVTLAVTQDLADGLIVAVVSGSLSIVGMTLAAIISGRSYRRHIRPDLRDLKGAVGADKRGTDHQAPRVAPDPAPEAEAGDGC